MSTASRSSPGCYSETLISVCFPYPYKPYFGKYFSGKTCRSQIQLYKVVNSFLSWTEPPGQPSKSWFLEASYVSSRGGSDISWSRKIICWGRKDRFAEQLQVLEYVLAAYTPQRTHAVASLFQGLHLTCSGNKGLISSFHCRRQSSLFLLQHM